MRKQLFTLFAILLFSSPLTAQNIATKTNLLMDATLSFSAGAEVKLAPGWTFDLSGSYNPWTLSENRKWKHWMIQPEFRFWFRESFDGWFIAGHAQGGVYNLGNLPFSLLGNGRYEGWFVGIGLAGGYQWILSRHFGLEMEIGAGYNYSRYDRYRCETCGEKLEEDMPYHYLGPTKASLAVIYYF